MIGLGLFRRKASQQGSDTEDADQAPAPLTASFSAALQAATAARDAAVALQALPSGSAAEPGSSSTPAPGSGGVQHSKVVAQGTEPNQQIRSSTSTQPASTSEIASSAKPVPPAKPVPSAKPVVPAVSPTGAGALAGRLQSALSARFTVLKALASGDAATLFLLEHRMYGGLFAAKVLHPELAAKPGRAAAFRDELSRAARLGDHPNAVPVVDGGERDGLLYLLMPYVEGADLHRILPKAGPLSREETLQLAAQISSLLCTAESLGLVHGGIQPDNIRLDVFGRYRLLGFGTSQMRGAQGRFHAPLNPLHSSPEQRAGDALDTRSDLYSLATVMCECLTSGPPLQAANADEAAARPAGTKWVLPASLHKDDALRRLLTSLLSDDPAKRPGSAYELSGILHALGWARPEFRPTPPGVDPFMQAPAQRTAR